MANPNVADQLISQIPAHIIESYPRFYDFLLAYYEWLSQEGSPYERVKNHMDYLSFEKSLDDYVEHMKQEYLSDVPDRVLVDKELFIKWSKTFNLSRGSHESIRFLFKLLFDEQSADIYVPKENILKTSDGTWISGESIMLLTHSGNNTQDFLYQMISQTRPIYNDIVETASAVVQRVRTKYIGRYVVTELSISNIKGEFKQDFPIISGSGKEEWLIPSLVETDVVDGGSGYQRGQRLLVDGYETFNVERQAESANVFDTRLTAYFNKVDLIVEVDSVILASTDYDYDGRYISSASITENSNVKVTLPTSGGYIIIDETDENGSVLNLDILESAIGSSDTNINLISSGIGSNFVGTISDGLVRPVKGYYRDTKGFLSSNMYIQDSFFYQSYSYSIKTQQDFSAYADIVKNVLHPAGFALFGQLNFTQVIEIILQYVEDEVSELPRELDIIHKYGLGNNYTLMEKSFAKLDYRLYRMSHLNNIIDSVYFSGELNYNLQSEFLGQLADYKYQPLKGWMNKFNYTDLHTYIQQNYSDDLDSGDLYFETGYTSDITIV